MESVFRRSEASETFRSGDEVEQVLGCPALGFIPQIVEEELRLIKDLHTFSLLTEAYRILRANLRFATTEKPIRSLLVTSAVPAEGKTMTTVNLAMALALTGKSVLIVDADLRCPSAHKIFKADLSPGLTDILIGTHSIDNATCPTGEQNMRLIPAGSPPPNPSELLESGAMARLIAEVETRYDIVLFDSPPLLPVADARVLSAQVNATLLVLSYDDTKVEAARKAMQCCARAKATVVGTVLNRIAKSRKQFFFMAGMTCPVKRRGGYRRTGYGSKDQAAGAGPEAPNVKEKIAVYPKTVRPPEVAGDTSRPYPKPLARAIQ